MILRSNPCEIARYAFCDLSICECGCHPQPTLEERRAAAAWLFADDSAKAPVQPHGQEDQDDQAPEPDPDEDPTQ